MGMYSSGGGQQQSTTKVVYDPQEKAARDEIMGLANWASRQNLGFADQPGSGNWWQYTGPKAVSPSQDTQNSWGWGANAMGQIDRGTNAAQSANEFGLSKALYANSNPYLAGHIQAAQRPLVEAFTGAGGPLAAIRGGSVANGTYGGSRQGIAEGLAAKGLMREMGDISTKMQSDAYTKGLDVQQQAIKNQGMLNIMRTMPGQIASQIGQQREGYQQNQENYLANVREQEKNGMWQPLQNMANLIYGGSSPSTQSTQSIPKQDNTMQAVGTLGSLGLMAMMFSDRRLKSQIRRVGTHARGFGIYVYKIFGRWQKGVMAQEVRKVLPEAVVRTPSGYLAVRYDLL